MRSATMRRWGWRAVLTGGCAITAGLALALPAFGHASFASASGFGFQPNTRGGTGGSTALPYDNGTTPTLYARVPYEQGDLFTGDTTVDVKVVVPDGWTNPACGDAMTQINDASTNNTNQPGSVVAGWTCALESAGGRAVLHWSGPAVLPPATAADSAQFFVFTVTVPSPASLTTYNGAAGSGTEGFIVDQTYASGEIEHWIPSADFPGTAPQGATTTVASGLARSVAPAGSVTTTSSTTTTTASATTTTVAAATTPATVAPAAELPRTGGSGTGPLALFGGALVLGGLLLVRKTRG